MYLINRKIIVAIGGILFLIVAIGIGIYLVQQKQIFFPKAFEGSNNIKEVTSSLPETSFTLTGPLEASVGADFKISVLVRSDLEAANLFAARLKFPPEILQVKEIMFDEGNSFVTNWIEKVADNVDGTISFVGGVPNPGYKTGNAPSSLATIVFTTKSPGKAYLTFNADSAIYRNSDNFNILDTKRELLVEVKRVGADISTCTPCLADMNKDGKVDEVDFARLQACFGKDASLEDEKGNLCKTADINSNGSVEIQDVSCLRTVMGQVCNKSQVTPISAPTPLLGILGKEGDVNGDKIVNLIDMSALLSSMGKKGSNIGGADFNKDGIVNSFDYSRMMNILIVDKVIQSSR